MRKFDEADREKKGTRIQIQENPANLSGEMVMRLENTVKSSLKDGYLPCPAAWKIAREADVPKIAVGEVADRLGIRVTDCQLGCFKVEKTPYDESNQKSSIDAEIAARIETLGESNKLTCENVFTLAKEMKLPPMAIADAVNNLDLKIRQCQLGCF
jgi:hypothetical protein